MEMVKDPKWVSPFSSEKILATISCRLEPSSPLAVDEEDMETRPEERDNFLLLLDRRRLLTVPRANALASLFATSGNYAHAVARAR